MYKHILYPADGSESAARALDHVIALADVFDAEVSVLYVYSLPLSAHLNNPLSFPTSVTDQIVQNLEQDGDHLVQKIKTKLKNEGIQAKTYVVEGNTKLKICEFAKKHDCDLIVMGTRGLGGSGINAIGSNIGSNSVYAIHHAQGIPVLVVD